MLGVSGVAGEEVEDEGEHGGGKPGQDGGGNPGVASSDKSGFNAPTLSCDPLENQTYHNPIHPHQLQLYPL